MELTDIEPVIVEPSIEERIALKQARAIDENALRSILLEARSANGFLPRPLPRDLLERLVELTELGPTSANSLPVRYVFVQSPEAKERLKPALADANRDKTIAAPVTAIVAADLFFYERFAETFPMRPKLGDNFAGAEKVESTRAFARDNALLQMGYFILAARALGLDCGPMAGFDRKLVDDAFFPDGRWISLYLINLGYDDGKRSFPRLPRLRPDEIARFV
jgi:3-hydroxypropanoate dehydrogenase